jgi:hypothetical protein
LEFWSFLKFWRQGFARCGSCHNVSVPVKLSQRVASSALAYEANRVMSEPGFPRSRAPFASVTSHNA